MTSFIVKLFVRAQIEQGSVFSNNVMKSSSWAWPDYTIINKQWQELQWSWFEWTKLASRKVKVLSTAVLQDIYGCFEIYILYILL